MCVGVCVWNPALMPSQCSIVPWTPTVIYVKILSSPCLIHPFSPLLLLLSLFFFPPLRCGFLSSGLSRPFSPPLAPPFLYCQTVSIFCSFSPSVTPPRFSTSVCFSACPFFSLPHCRPVLISISSSYSLQSLCLCCHPSIPCIHLTLSFSALFHVLPLSVGLTPEVVKSKKKKKKANRFYRH